MPNKKPHERFTTSYMSAQTGDLNERFDDHHKQQCFDNNAKTHIGVRGENVEQARLGIERDLLRNYKTACNF